MKRIHLYLLAGIIAISASAFTYNEQGKTYEYMTLHQNGFMDLQISHSQTGFEKYSVKDQAEKNPSNFRPILEKVAGYRSQGWDVLSSEFNQTSAYFVMEREK